MKSLTVAVALLCAANAHAAKPNVVVFLVDDLGVMDVGCYNPKTFYETPNIDRLATGGMRFTDAYAATPASTSTCIAEAKAGMPPVCLRTGPPSSLSTMMP